MGTIKKSTQVAAGGLSAALCMLLMFLTGLFPFATYALPAAAGIMLICVCVEIGFSTALLVYAAVSWLSVFVCPDREAALMFICFFGYYPALRFQIQRINSGFPRCAVKLSIFSLSMAAGYEAVTLLLGIPDPMADIAFWGISGKWLLLLIGCAIFLVYDRMISNVAFLYRHRFRSQYLGRY